MNMQGSNGLILLNEDLGTSHKLPPSSKVAGELSNGGMPMRKFTQTFVLEAEVRPTNLQ